MASIEQKAARGAAWTIGFGLGSRLLGVFATLFLTDYILPDDYGAVILANVVAVTTAVFSSCGLPQYLIVRKDLDRQDRFHVSVFYLLISTAALLSVIWWRVPILNWLEISSAAPYLPWLCIALLLDRIAMLPEKMLSRQFEFRKIALARATTETVYAATAIGCAMLGFQGMSIVYANLARFGLLVLIMYRLVSIRTFLTPTSLQWNVTRRMFAFGLPLSVDGLSHFASRQWDNLLMGRFFGDNTAGVYNLAYNLADIPATHVGEHIGDVLLPSFSQMEGDRRRNALVKSTGFLAIIVFPMAFGLAVVAPTITEVIFRPEWAMVAPMLSLLAGLSIVRPVGWTMTSYLQSMTLTRPVMVLGFLRLVMLLVALVMLKPFGPMWACTAAGAAYTAHAIGGMWIVSRRDNVAIQSILAELWPALSACLPMVLTVLGIRYSLSERWGIGFSLLACQILVGACTYVLAMWLISPKSFYGVVSQVQAIIKKRAQDEDDEK